MQAAIGLEQLKRLPHIVARRRALGDTYRRLLCQEVPRVTPPHEPAWARTNWQSYCVRLPNDVDQRSVMQFMLNKGIATRRGIMCIHREEAYASPSAPALLRNSEEAQDHCIILPMFPQMTEAMLMDTVQALKEVVSA